MFQIYASVKVSNPEHPRFGQTGAVFSVNDDASADIAVRFDLDQVVDAVAVADLKAL
jgi:hypothetical protein